MRENSFKVLYKKIQLFIIIAAEVLFFLSHCKKQENKVKIRPEI